MINLNSVENLKLEVLPLKNWCVSLGTDTTAQAAGETRPLTMTLGPNCSDKSRYTVIELEDHDLILCRPFLSYMAARVVYLGDSWGSPDARSWTWAAASGLLVQHHD